MNFDLRQGNNLEILPTIESNSIDSIVTDPPYEINMGVWDKNSIAFNYELWYECLRVLKPGGHLVAFSFPRQYHKLANAIDDVGFEIRDQIIWLFGQGLPKSFNLGEGRGTNLKPAHEPILLARKPISEPTLKRNLEVWGTGSLYIDVSRLPTHAKKWVTPRGGIWKTDSTAKSELVDNTLGRFPSNVLHDGIIEEEPWSKYFYCSKASKADKGENNNHPTVKPTDLMRYLCRLVTPPEGTVLDPFMGSGSTAKACLLERFSFIGIEILEEYISITNQRLKLQNVDTDHA